MSVAARAIPIASSGYVSVIADTCVRRFRRVP